MPVKFLGVFVQRFIIQFDDVTTCIVLTMDICIVENCLEEVI